MNSKKMATEELCTKALQPLFDSFDRTADLSAVDEFFDSFDVDFSWYYMKKAFKISVSVEDLNIKNVCREMKKQSMPRKSVAYIRRRLNEELLDFLDIYYEIYDSDPEISIMVLIKLFIDKKVKSY